MNWPFHPGVTRNDLVRIDAAGFGEPVPGIVFSGSKLAGGVPLGGLGTGYFTIEGSGQIGVASIFNDLAPPKEVRSDWLTVKIGQNAMPLSVADSAYWGHYPFSDMVAKFREHDIEIGARAFAPFIVGDAAASNIPASLFELEITNNESAELEIELALEFPAPVKQDQSVELSGPDFDGLIQPAAGGDTIQGSMKLRVASGGSSKTRFVYSWYAPHWRDSGSERHVHRYGQRYGSAAEVAEDCLSRFDDLAERALSWQRFIYTSEYPDWLKDWLVQSFYSLAKNGVWIARTRKDEWWGSDGWFSHSESHTECPITETMVCRMHGNFPLLYFFPELELSTLSAFKHFQISDGEIPFSFGMTTSMRDPRYHCQHPLNSGQYAQMIYRLYLRTRNRDTLAELYDSAKRAIRYQYTLDDDEDGLINDQPHTREDDSWPANQFYDIWPWWGTSAYVAGTWLATLSSGAAMASDIGDVEFEEECRSRLLRGTKAYNEKLWNGAYYRLWSDEENAGSSNVSLANQLMAIWCNRILGLEPPLEHKKVESALSEVIRLNMAATEFGLVNGVTPEGERYITQTNPDDHGAQIFVGENLCAAMTFIYEDQETIGISIAKRLYDALFIKTKSPWNQRCLISSDTGLPVWGEDYYSNMVIWALPMALGRKDIAQFTVDGELIQRMIKVKGET